MPAAAPADEANLELAQAMKPPPVPDLSPSAQPPTPAPTLPAAISSVQTIAGAPSASENEHYSQPSPVLAAPQAVDFNPTVACQNVKKPCVLVKKPCVLKVWFQKITSCGRGAETAGCHHHRGSSPCCSGCTCGTGNMTIAEASPQASMASAAGGPASSGVPPLQPAAVASTGAEPGDVAEEGKLFERVSFDRFDKSP